jgi:hypothetical protein
LKSGRCVGAHRARFGKTRLHSFALL